MPVKLVYTAAVVGVSDVVCMCGVSTQVVSIQIVVYGGVGVDLVRAFFPLFSAQLFVR